MKIARHSEGLVKFPLKITRINQARHNRIVALINLLGLQKLSLGVCVFINHYVRVAQQPMSGRLIRAKLQQLGCSKNGFVILVHRICCQSPYKPCFRIG